MRIKADLSGPFVIRIAAISALLFFWAASLWNLDRYPFPYYDEGIIIAPGWKLVTAGTQGSDPYTGYYGAEQIFFQNMPLFAMLEGATMRFIGLGLFQARFLAVSVGLLFLALTYAVATRLFDSRTGVWSVLLLLTWQMLPGDGPVYRTGIPMLDLMRVARNDTLAAMWGLAAFWCFMRARETEQRRFYALCGFLTGLAGLSHIYGLFWGGGFRGCADRRTMARRPFPVDKQHGCARLRRGLRAAALGSGHRPQLARLSRPAID